MNIFDNYSCDGQMSIDDYLLTPTKINKKIRLIELFAGVGSQAMALRNIGADFEHHRVVEIDKYAMASYNAIHGTEFETSDISKLKSLDLGITDTDTYTYIMTYSFPCQDLSVAGKMRGMEEGSGTRSSLLFEVGRLLGEVENLPQVLLMENVPQVLSKRNEEAFDKWKTSLEQKGYRNYIQLLNAKDYGVAQSRNRCFMVSVLGDKSYKFPKPIPLKKVMKDYLENEVDEKFYIKSDKAKKLINKLVVGGKILNNRQTDSVNGLGFIEKGTGKHQSNMVYDTNGLLPSEYAVQWKDAAKIIECVAITTDGSSPKHNNRIVLIKQATKEGTIPCEVGGGVRSKLPGQQNTQRKGTRQRTDMPDSDNGEYP